MTGKKCVKQLEELDIVALKKKHYPMLSSTHLTRQVTSGLLKWPVVGRNLNFMLFNGNFAALEQSNDGGTSGTTV